MFEVVCLHFGIRKAAQGACELFLRKVDCAALNPDTSEYQPGQDYLEFVTSVLKKLDKRVRGFNGLRANPDVDRRSFATLWSKVVDKSQGTEKNLRLRGAFTTELDQPDRNTLEP